MQVSELFDIEPCHHAMNEISRQRIDYGEEYAPVGQATLWLSGLIPGASLGDRALFGIYGVHGEELLVQYEGGFRHGTGHRTGGRAEPCLWVHASAFPDGIEIYAQYRQPHRSDA